MLNFRLIIGFVQSRDGYTWQGVLYAFGMFFSSILAVVFMHHSFNISYTTGMRVRTALSAAIYRKVL